MTAMKPARRFTATVLVGWIFLALAAIIYARIKAVPAVIAIPLAAAFLIEFPFYLLPAFSPQRLSSPIALAATCVLPYLVYSIPTGEFHLTGFALLAGIALVLSFWFALLPKHPITDFLFLAAAAAIYISKAFDTIFISPIPKVQIATLGHVMLIRTCALAILAIRGSTDVEFRFLPTAREWRIGFAWFAALVPACAIALLAVKLNFTPHPAAHIWLLFPEFLGILWVVALSEEFAFRGLLQQWFEQWTASPAFALIAASVLFGCAHLGFNHIFPNWRFAIVAAVFGLCCGLAWRQSRTIQSAMVTHALGATLYRIFFQP
jgi:membrane protease YdiL (CAAX protease family)